MSNGVYGTRIPSNISQNDVEIYYTYRPTLNSSTSENLIFHKLDSSILVKSSRVLDGEIDNVVEGMYNLKLPVNVFNKKGFYTVYIKPKEIKTVIADVGTLASFPSVRGIVIDTEKIPISDRHLFTTNNGIVGYRIIYFDKSLERDDYYRIVTSNNRCEPLTQSVTNSNDKVSSYRYNENSTLTFVTVSPSSAPSFKANELPYIGLTSQQVVFVNTKFEPIAIDIEMVEHDADTISTMLEYSQLRDLDNGLITTFNDDGEIYHQSEHYTLKDEYTGNPVFEIKKMKKGDIDFTQTLEDK